MVKIIASYVHFKGALAENYLFCNRYHPKMAIKTSLKNVGDNMDGDTHVWSIPLYVIFRLKEYVAHEMGW